MGRECQCGGRKGSHLPSKPFLYAETAIRESYVSFLHAQSEVRLEAWLAIATQVFAPFFW